MFEVTWLLFIVTSLVLIVTPGQDMILVMSRSIARGSAAGVATAAGVSVGLVGHTVLATLGLGAILFGGHALHAAGQQKSALIILWLLALPGILGALFFLLLIITQPRWN